MSRPKSRESDRRGGAMIASTANASRSGELGQGKKERVRLQSLPSHNTRCRFGVAVRDVTPPVGIYARWWGATPHEQATGIHRPFTATVAVFTPLEGDGPHQVMVGLDQCSFQ